MPDSRFSSEEILFVENVIKNSPWVTNQSRTLNVVKDFETKDLDSLIFDLGLATSRPGTSYLRMPEWEMIGKQIWYSYCHQLRDAICGDSDIYKEERAKLQTNTESAIIILIPLVLSLLKITPAMSGVAVVLPLMILKIGLKTFCATAGDLQKLRGKPGQICSVVHPLNWTQGQNKINCVHEGVQNGSNEKEL